MRHGHGTQYIVFSAVIALSVSFAFVHGQSFANPPGSAPDNGSLNTFSASNDFIKKSFITTSNNLAGSLVFASSTTASAIVGDIVNNVSVSGFAGITLAPPALSAYGIPGAAVYGYAQSTGSSAGAYGYAAGSNAFGVVGSTGAAPDIQSLDTVDDVGKYSSITIGVDGLPIIAYHDNTRDDLLIAHCTTVSCSTKTRVVIDGPGDTGEYNSITIGRDGKAIVSYADDTENRLEVAHCNDIPCTSATIAPIIDPGSTNYGRYSSIRIGTDGYPVISYNDEANSDLRFVHCTSADCSTHDAPICITGSASGCVYNSAVSAGTYTSMAIGSNGLPVIAYHDSSAGKLKVAHCATTTCSSLSTPTPTAIADGKQDNFIAIGIDSLPIILFSNQSGGIDYNYIVHCSTFSCTSFGTPLLVGTNADEGSLAIASDGFAIASFFDQVNTALRIAHCADVQCTALDPAQSFILDAAPTSGIDTSITIGSDGFPIISYHDVSPLNLKVAHCNTVTCYGGNAGKFLGPVKVTQGTAPGNVYVQDLVTTPRLKGLSGAGQSGVYSSNGISITGMFDDGVYGESDNNFGVYGKSSSTYAGLYGFNSVSSGSGTIFTGIRGDTFAPTGGAGVFGWSTKGNGVAGLVSGLSNTNWAVEGKATGVFGTSDYNAGVYGRGDAFAGFFDGDVTIDSTYRVFINRSGMTEAALCNMIKWCKAQGSCPDNYYSGGAPC